MWELEYTNKFLRQFEKCDNTIKKKAVSTIKKIEKDPFERSLKTHNLKGKLTGTFSCSVDFSYRILFDINMQKITFVAIGNHEIYKI